MQRYTIQKLYKGTGVFTIIKKMDKDIKIKYGKIIYLRGNEIFCSQSEYQTLINYTQSELMVLAKEFDEDFYTNDGYHLILEDLQFEYSYDDGYGQYDFIVLGE